MKPGRELVSLLVMLGAVVGALALAAILQRSPAAATRSSPSLARTAVAVLPVVAERVERIRGLRFDSVPRPRVVSAARFRLLSERDARRDDAERRLASAEIEAKLLGLVDAEADLSSLVGDSSELAAAAYDPRTGRLFVIRDAVPGGRALIEFVLAHELTHALEDQRFDLSDPEEGGDDRALAQLALVEGTAGAVMTDYARRHLDPLQLAGSALGLDTSNHGVPDFLVKQLLFAYLRGATFVDELRRAAAGWNVVDIAIRSGGPESTEQVMHPHKYLLGESPLQVRVDAAPGGGWRRVDAGTIGEFATAQLLELGGDRSSARRASAGWGGDRYVLWGRGEEPAACKQERSCRSSFALALAWRWDSAAERRQFMRALRDYVRVGLAANPSGRDLWSLPGGWAAIAVREEVVRLALAPEQVLATQLVLRGAASGP